MDLLGVQLLGEGGEVGHIGEEDGDDLALPFEGGAGGEDLVGQVLGGVGGRLGGIYDKGFFPFLESISTLIAERRFRWQDITTLRTIPLQLPSTLEAKFRFSSILELAVRAFHFLLSTGFSHPKDCRTSFACFR